MNEEYIGKGKVLDLINEERKFYEEEKKKETDTVTLYMLCGSDNALVGVEDGINDIEPDDVAPVVHGKWIFNDDWQEFRCTNCDKAIGNAERYKYCPHCGARMDLE